MNTNRTKNGLKMYIQPKKMISFRKLKMLLSNDTSWNKIHSDWSVNVSLISIKSEQKSKIVYSYERLGVKAWHKTPSHLLTY